MRPISRAIVSLLLASAMLSSMIVSTAEAAPTLGVADIDTVVEEYRDAVAVPGVAVTVTKGDSTIAARGYGHTADGEPATAQSVMAMASVSKSFTGLAVMQLVDRGQVDLDRSVQQYLPEFQPGGPWDGQITVRQLLEQTSGLNDSVVSQFSRTQPSTLEVSVADFRDVEPVTEPGTQWSYYNPNFQIAARLVEVVAEQPFDDYLDEQIFTPLGMSDSATINTDKDLPFSAHGYLVLLESAAPMPEPPAFGAGSGGVLSTAEDMASWLKLQSGAADPGAAISPTALEVTHTPSSLTTEGYALGWSTGRTVSGSRLLHHAGDLFTSTAYQAVLPDSGYGIAVMTNTGMAHGDAAAIAQRLIALVDGRSPDPAAAQPGMLVDVVFFLMGVAALGLGVRGALRAGSWARTQARPARYLARLLHLLAPSLLLVLAAPVLSVLYRGRDVTFTQTCYLYPAFMLALAALSAAGITVLCVRVGHICALRRKTESTGGQQGA